MKQEHIEKMRAARQQARRTVAEYLQQMVDAGVDKDTIRQAKVRLSQMPESLRLRYSKAVLGKASAQSRIKSFCVECQGYQKLEVANCTDKGCPLYGLRPIYVSKSKRPCASKGDSS